MRRLPFRIAFFAILLAHLLSRTLFAAQDEPTSPRNSAPLTILQMNDVYSALPIDGAGGLARVATLKQQVAATGHTPLLVLAGDFLSPSVASSVFKGEQMIAALNAAGLDMATLGNHEFDFGIDVLIQRMAEAKWQWVISNVVDATTKKPIGGAAPYVVRTFGSLRVGFIGLVLTTAEITSDKLAGVRMIDPLEATAMYLPALKRQNVNVIVALTHLSFADDRALARRFPDIDLIVGGHEHYPITAAENRTLISKAGSDAKFVARIDVNLASSIKAPARQAGVERFYELIPVTAALADEPRTAAVIASYESRLGSELEKVVGNSRTSLDADTVRVRGAETNLGDLVADAARIDADADVAIINAGSIRGDRVYPPGPITRRMLVEMHPLGDLVCKIAATGRIVLEALNHGVSKLPATAGQFPQVSGLTMTVNALTDSDRVRDVKINGRELDPNKIYTVATTDYQLKGGDGYNMFAGQKVLVSPETGDLLLTALEKYLTSKGEVAPAVEGRITIVR